METELLGADLRVFSLGAVPLSAELGLSYAGAGKPSPGRKVADVATSTLLLGAGTVVGGVAGAALGATATRDRGMWSLLGTGFGGVGGYLLGLSAAGGARVLTARPRPVRPALPPVAVPVPVSVRVEAPPPRPLVRLPRVGRRRRS